MTRPDTPDCPRCGSPGASFSTHPCNPPDTPAQEHADTVREALNFGYGGDPNYRPFYEDGITALDALLAHVERLTAENGRMEQELDAMDSRRAFEWERAEAAESEVERLTAERSRRVSAGTALKWVLVAWVAAFAAVSVFALLWNLFYPDCAA